MRSARPPFEAPIADDIPSDVNTLSLEELESDHEDAISEEFERMRFQIESSLQSRSRVDKKISSISDNTNAELSFIKGVATMRLIDHYGLYEAYEQATEVRSGPKVLWRFVFPGPRGVGQFTTMYQEETIQGVKTRTQKLLFCAQP